ncbi:MAG: chemotaxis protein CheR [Candidatus Eisenbacteria bacterium]|uniref:protein-glutamate O-methyltransferase n=1 Tax=Eiseniibacteriota bacterium TaxID=2212470 RepID=A0A538T0U9_UNCEI|nr:MAG: chemotaxis protein CheR [Candidatus Eisenbacteria bacterium]
MAEDKRNQGTETDPTESDLDLETEAEDEETLLEERGRGTDEERLFVAGIGASAGGLEALGELVKHVPLDSIAFVVVQHLAPHHESFLTKLLSRTSKVQVETVTDGTVVEPNHVYVLPPNNDLGILHGVLRLIPPSGGDRPHLPIDYFFRSLAQDQGSSAIGIILSGTGTDGTLGLRAIKEAGGISFVQTPASAKYDGMPRSALASGFADFCKTPKDIGEELTRIAHQPRALALPMTPSRAPQIQEQIARLFLLVRSTFGNDLSRYKASTVERRIERRMTLNRIGKLDEYVRFVQSNSAELQALYRDMLITVTNFFRDQAPFEMLKTRILPQVLDKKDGRAPIRVWVPACATGEEAYSIAICLVEFLGEQASEKRIQIFGTDVDEESIRHARRGVYPLNIELDVSPERLSRFFLKRDSEYQVSRRIRDMVVFSKQNLLRDAPFSRMDLVSCRNLLIYLQPSSQKKVLSILHYALLPSGYLMLGTSETVGDAPDLFSLVDRKTRIYSKKHVANVSTLDEILAVPGDQDRIQPGSNTRPIVSLQALADRKILEMYGPPGVLVNENLDILHFRGHTGPYVNPSPGAASFNILKLARPELHIELRRNLQEALASDKRVSAEVKFYENGKPNMLTLDIVPMQEPETKTRCLLVSFLKQEPPEEDVPPESESTEPEEHTHGAGKRVHELERELLITKEYLQSTIEDKESANEELKSANEELQSSNEELQSTNEELETSREEMQSTNEELTTVNEELQNRMTELSQSNDDLHNVLVGLDSPVIIVGMDLRIRRFTGSAERLLNLLPADVGRSISFLDAFVGGDMASRARQVIDTLSLHEEEVLCRNQRWYLLRISPYKTLDHTIRGAVASLVDIDLRKRAAALTRNVGDYADKFLGAIRHPLVMLDEKLRIVWANHSYYERYQLVPEETVGHIFPSPNDPTWKGARLRERLEHTLESGETLRDFQVAMQSSGANDGMIRLGASRVPVATDSTLLLVSIEETAAP